MFDQSSTKFSEFIYSFQWNLTYARALLIWYYTDNSLADLLMIAAVKGQIKPKADWRAVDSPKKWTKESAFFCPEKQKGKKKIIHSLFLGESTASQSAYGFI